MALVSTNIATGLDYRFLNFAATLGTAATGFQNVFGTAGSIYSITILNNTGSGEAGILKLYDTTAAVTPGTTVPSHCLPFTYNASSTAMSTTYVFPEGLSFSSGLGVAVSKDNSPGTPAGSDLGATVTSCVIAYK